MSKVSVSIPSYYFSETASSDSGLSSDVSDNISDDDTKHLTDDDSLHLYENVNFKTFSPRNTDVEDDNNCLFLTPPLNFRDAAVDGVIDRAVTREGVIDKAVTDKTNNNKESDNEGSHDCDKSEPCVIRLDALQQDCSWDFSVKTLKKKKVFP